MRFWGHLINEGMQDIFTITGSPPGKATYNHALDWEKYNSVQVHTGGGKHIIEAAMS